MELTTFQSVEDGVLLDVEVAPDDSDVVVEETGVAMVGGEDVGVVDACVEFPVEGG